MTSLNVIPSRKEENVSSKSYGFGNELLIKNLRFCSNKVNSLNSIVIDKLLKLGQCLCNVSPGKIILEGAHVYVNGFDEKTFYRELSLMREVVRFYNNFLFEVEGRLFVDDYTYRFNGDLPNISVDNIGDIITGKEMCFIQEIHREGDESLLSRAKILLEELKLSGKTIEKGGKIYLKRGHILLYDKNIDKYSCAILDAVFSLRKYESGDSIINILPYDANLTSLILSEGNSPSYVAQQYKVRTILREFTDKHPNSYPPFFNIFFDEEKLKKGDVEIKLGIPNFARKFIDSEENNLNFPDSILI